MDIALDRVALRYQSGVSPETHVLHDVSFTVPAGSFYFITGPSGAGKTSLLKLLSLTLRPSEGALSMFGVDTTQLDREALPPLRRRIGAVYQDFRLLDHLNVAENVSLPLRIAGEPAGAIHTKVKQLLTWVGLKDHMHAKPETLSGGQKQRAAIARAVIVRPDIILADEPTGNLDPALALKCMYLFETMHKDGATVLFATHDTTLIERFRYPVLRLQEGKVIRSGGNG